MQVILLENIKKIGKIGDVVDVKRGYARNFLIKNNKALFASKENIKEVGKKKEELNKKDSDIKKEAKKSFDILNNKKFKVEKLVTENNELYGSVKPTEVAKLISSDLETNIEPSQIDLKSEIKAIGEFKVIVNLHPEIQANILIEVVKSK